MPSIMFEIIPEESRIGEVEKHADHESHVLQTLQEVLFCFAAESRLLTDSPHDEFKEWCQSTEVQDACQAILYADSYPALLSRTIDCGNSGRFDYRISPFTVGKHTK